MNQLHVPPQAGQLAMGSFYRTFLAVKKSWSVLILLSVLLLWSLVFWWATRPPAPALPAVGDMQLIVGITPAWDEPRGMLQLFERVEGKWEAVSEPIRAQHGRRGLAWGRGLRGQDEPGERKEEGDRRAPAGLFQIGLIYTNDPELPEGIEFPFHHVTELDAWIDDPAHPLYNQHFVADPADPPEWFKSQRMRHDDPLFQWRIEVRHNSDPPVPGAGSAIFFHKERVPEGLSAGCTVLPEEDLLRLMQWMDAGMQPHYVLLPWEQYLRVWNNWGLPEPGLVEAHPDRNFIALSEE